ncbi:MAG: peroxiredoxin [Bacteroidetes bacterium HGW-Bacteroidetes-13]|jgi:peroxiredoxin Q/BCP|nr:MAG: peroxiredoxin [Bacteroidetes bacterium HGW-Bacteroidetes-13]
MAIQMGDKIPEFSLKDQDGNAFSIASLIGKKVLVIYFYPKDYTPGCTKEACSFRDSYEDFKTMGAEVIGISDDSVSRHLKFSKSYKLPFILLSDSGNKVRKRFGVPSNLFGLIPGRVTYVVDKNGIVVLVFDSMNASLHIKKAKETIDKLQNL